MVQINIWMITNFNHCTDIFSLQDMHECPGLLGEIGYLQLFQRGYLTNENGLLTSPAITSGLQNHKLVMYGEHFVEPCGAYLQKSTYCLMFTMVPFWYISV